jgi:tripartite-type tricarboxylate transporter receptor subunit TctC
VRGLAVTTAERSAAAPEFPTIAEAGVPGYDVSGWYSLFVPAKTAPEIVRRMNADTVAMLAEPATKARFEPLGIDVRSSTPDELAARVRTEIALWGPTIKAAGIKAE